jgi:4-amino-4-deoxy-L-arabinose transferase-like glycosyltransferase
MVSARPRRQVQPLRSRKANVRFRAAVRRTPHRRLELAVLGLLVAYAIAVRLVVAVQLPPWQGPDEPKHFEYVRMLLDMRQQLWSEHRLLAISDSSPAFEQQVLASMAANHFYEYVGQPNPDPPPATFYELWRGSGSELHRPSLYYFAAAAFVAPLLQAPIEQQLLAVRVFSALLGGLTVVIAYAAGRAAWPNDRFVAVVAGAFVAALPMNVFIGGVASVDNLATLVGGVVALGITRGVTAGFRRREWLLVLGGLVIGLATKREFVGVLPGIALAALLWAVRQRVTVRLPKTRPLLLAATALVALGAALAIFTDLLARLADAVSAYALNEPDQIRRLLQPPVTGAELLALLGNQWRLFVPSFWGMFGWFAAPLSPGLNTLLNVVTVLCLFGLVATLLTHRGSDRAALRWLVAIYAVLILTMTVLAFGIALSYFSPTEIPQGRHIFGVLVPIAMLFAVGARAWLPSRWLGTWLPAGVLVLLLIALDVAAYRESFAPYFLDRIFS